LEFQDILNYLYTVSNGLNLTRTGNATAWDNHVAFIEALVPNKTDALRYLDSGVPVPPRYAHVVINRGATKQAAIVEYSVGPLPTSQETKIKPLTWPYNSGRNYVRNPLPQYEEIINWFADLGHEISDIVKDLLGEVNQSVMLGSSFCLHVEQILTPGESEDIPPYVVLSQPSSWNENGTISSWAAVHGNGNRFDAWSLLARGLYCHFEITRVTLCPGTFAAVFGGFCRGFLRHLHPGIPCSAGCRSAVVPASRSPKGRQFFLHHNDFCIRTTR